MLNNRLKQHYEQKYNHESANESIPPVRRTKTPVSRFEAIVTFFGDYFKGGDILELGAGNGNVAKTLLEMDHTISSYTLGDISTPRLEGLKKNLNDPRIKVLELNAENVLDTENGMYDVVIMIALIEHLIDPIGAMQNIGKLLKPGGFAYIDTPNVAKYTHRLQLLFGRFPSTASRNEGLTTYSGQLTDLHDEGHFHYFTYRSLSKMLTERCGFSKIVKLHYASDPMPLGESIHNWLARLRPELFSEIAMIAYT